MTSMTPDLLAALALFCFAASITPGPNNAMLLASGANFGLKRTLPHMAGVVLGFAFLILVVGLGLGALFAAYPAAHTALKVLGGAYLLWLAFKIARAKGVGPGAASGRPMSFLQAAAFQWVNPKAYVMAIGAVATYIPRDGSLGDLLLLTLVFGVVNLPCVSVWMVTGVGLRRVLERPGALRAFNLTMAALLVASLYPLGIEAWRWAAG
jgi:threonine/homoserine/homoserine lactone efflux protein